MKSLIPMEPIIYFKCTACSECFMSEDIFFAHTRTWHCKILVSEGQDAETATDDFEEFTSTCNSSNTMTCSISSNDNLNECKKMDGKVRLDVHFTKKNFIGNVVLQEPVLEEVIMTDDRDVHNATNIESNTDSAELHNDNNSDEESLQQYLDPCEVQYVKQEKYETNDGENSTLSPTARESTRHAFSHHAENAKMPQIRHLARTNYVKRMKKLQSSSVVPTEGKIIKQCAYLCRFCRKAFRSAKHVEMHERIHTGEKPYFCNVCGKGFSLEGNLKTHMRIHTGEKPFGCNVCGKSFNLKGNLKTHMRIHTGEKPFVCFLCHWRFSQSCNLKSHMKTHTDSMDML